MPKRTTKKDDPPVMKRIIFGKSVSRDRDLHDEIAQRAYELFLERGGTDGHADEDWLQAELEVRREKGRA
jgi:hypothetical protein